MNIEVWSDIVCPFCYIGKKRLEEALKQFPHNEDVNVIFRSFELNPEAPIHSEGDYVELLAKKYNTSQEQIVKMNNQLTEQAKEVGLTYHLDQVKPTNTLDAHRLIHFAKKNGKENEMVVRLFDAYFTEVKHIADHSTLIQLAVEIGLNEQEVKEMLASNLFEDVVRQEENDAQQIGVTGVPFFVINRKYAISGAQPIEVFLEVLEKVKQEDSN
ncbi:DsbA family oxidoreductase [Metabacillus litoralis]|uniref:DsbA family oxidoreductase n=1 Tax=Metabacillus litoralis TaxID=152268 RepID=UPI001CFD4A4D|nr:DsbA family oxidoreductase [Metabacillus litoralis]